MQLEFRSWRSGIELNLLISKRFEHHTSRAADCYQELYSEYHFWDECTHVVDALYLAASDLRGHAVAQASTPTANPVTGPLALQALKRTILCHPSGARHKAECRTLHIKMRDGVESAQSVDSPPSSPAIGQFPS